MRAADNVLMAPGADPRAFRRVMIGSLAVHLVATAALFVPELFFGHRAEQTVMTISLGGSPGPRSTGQTPVSSRPVEEVAPPPKRPERIQPATAKPDVMTVPVKPAPPKPEVKKPEPVAPAAAVTRPPVTGTELNKGTAVADTGARGQGAGLTFGGGTGTEASLDVTDFCCKEYVDAMLDRIRTVWKQDVGVRGHNVMRFTIERDGRVVDIGFDQYSGLGLLDRYSKLALTNLTLPPLPPQYTGQTLTIHLKFDYGGK